MSNSNLTAADRQRFAHARGVGREFSHCATTVVDARYDAESDAILLTFGDGETIAIPRKLVPGLEQVPASVVASVSVSPAGDAISWRSVDIDVAVSGLVERSMGRKRRI